jgi:hypothetical protein
MVNTDGKAMVAMLKTVAFHPFQRNPKYQHTICF